MQINKLGIILLTVSLLSGCGFRSKSKSYVLYSPDHKFEFKLVAKKKELFYQVNLNGKRIIGESKLGLRLNGTNLSSSYKIHSVEEKSVDSTWIPLYGERNLYPDKYNQAIIHFGSESNQSSMSLEVRAYEEGIAFRYLVESENDVTVLKEYTEFHIPEESELWTAEFAQAEIKKYDFSEIKNIPYERPLLAEVNDSLYITIGEAALVDFARMKLKPVKRLSAFRAHLESEVQYSESFKSPWRVVMAENSVGRLLENNYLYLNLNEPCEIKDTYWIKPGKAIRSSLTTEIGMACVDFAVENNFQYVEFDAGWYGNEYEDSSDATTVSREGFKLHEIIQYANKKNIKVMLYVNRRALEKQLDELLPLYKAWGVSGVKYGFVQVGSQEWTAWLHHAIRKAAEYELVVDVHDEYRPTGFSRTYPNLLTVEGVRGDEMSPDNTLVLKTLFTRMLAGAADHTNCYFAPRVDTSMGSHASQLAKTICLYSPLQFLFWYDRPMKKDGSNRNSRYVISDVPELFFFKKLPVTWDNTKVIEAQIGKYATIARKKNDDWYIGAINGNKPRNFTLPLNFLDENSVYNGIVFSDDSTLETITNVVIDTINVSSEDILNYKVDSLNGIAIILEKANN